MVEDKLDEGQRVRLEALAQAIAYVGMKPGTDSDGIVQVAKRFEKYINLKE